MKLDELFGSLRTFKLHLGEGKSKRKTGIAVTSVKEERIEESKVSANEESVAESIELLTKQLQSLLYQRQVSNQSKRINRRRIEWRPKVNMENCKVALTSVHKILTLLTSIITQVCTQWWSLASSLTSRLLPHFVHLSFALFESSHMTPIDVGTTPFVICLSMRLFQDSHILDVSAEFDTESGESRASSTVSPTIDQPLVLSAVALESVVSSNDS
ncbi:flocculation protein FLO11-like [Cucumis melo var. makuwa]|uniref:Flocculation protein FLO11-like n=1 Tax=Cucumis melo var. makuwa TaxID=1194695 RepID=A0A5D3DG65_CUCMM|nr:flocculation protein FLO11-like [Cucumis melo var. makuwa]TYK22697.1 flocculation protein FLO11-like [Cucumis melo var. makuwa]